MPITPPVNADALAQRGGRNTAVLGGFLWFTQVTADFIVYALQVAQITPARDVFSNNSTA